MSWSTRRGAISGVSVMRVHRYALPSGVVGPMSIFTVTVGPVPVPVARILDAAAAGRHSDAPLITRRDGHRMDRNTAWRRVRTIAAAAGLPAGRVHPHTLRAAAITAALDAGVPVRDVQAFANHADPGQTLRYDRNGASLDRHPAFLLAGVIAA